WIPAANEPEVRVVAKARLLRGAGVQRGLCVGGRLAPLRPSRQNESVRRIRAEDIDWEHEPSREVVQEGLGLVEPLWDRRGCDQEGQLEIGLRLKIRELGFAAQSLLV